MAPAEARSRCGARGLIAGLSGSVWRRDISRRPFRATLSHRHESGTQYALAYHVAGLDHLDDAAWRLRAIGHFVHGLVQIRIELLPLGIEFLDAVSLQSL